MICKIYDTFLIHKDCLTQALILCCSHYTHCIQSWLKYPPQEPREMIKYICSLWRSGLITVTVLVLFTFKMMINYLYLRQCTYFWLSFLCKVRICCKFFTLKFFTHVLFIFLNLPPSCQSFLSQFVSWFFIGLEP
jgi:hypothetical protein